MQHPSVYTEQIKAINDEIKATEAQLKYLLMKLRFKAKEEYDAYIYLQAKEASANYWLSSESDEVLKQLSCEPLKATTDPLKLKELEGRFPGATFILSLPREQIEVKTWEVGNQKKNGWVDIWSKTHANVFPTFKAHGAGDKPQLMAEWNGLYIDLSHLF